RGLRAVSGVEPASPARLERHMDRGAGAAHPARVAADAGAGRGSHARFARRHRDRRPRAVLRPHVRQRRAPLFAGTHRRLVSGARGRAARVAPARLARRRPEPGVPLSIAAKTKMVVAGLAALTLWPLMQLAICARWDASPWKLAGWGMYATPR